MKTFQELFKKYRLRAEFSTLSELGMALAERGLIYEDSIFSHWQKGTRYPSRQTLIKLIELFIDRKAIISIEEANQFLESAKYGYLTEKDKENFHFHKPQHVPFQVPNEIANFIGRKNILDEIKKEIVCGRVYLLHGPPGIGKTALAIQLGHLLKHAYPDGVLWYKVDSSNILDILLSIARLLGEDIHTIKDIEVRSSVVRTLLLGKKILLIFDNVTKQDKIHLLLPNTKDCSVIFTSQEQTLAISAKYTQIALEPFNMEETLSLFEHICNKEYVAKNKKTILDISHKVDNLPLALHLIASNSNKSHIPLHLYSNQLSEQTLDLHSVTYEDKNLYRAFSIAYDSLQPNTKRLFLSSSIFEGKDFPIDAVAFINRYSLNSTKECMQQLVDISFIEQSSSNRYRMHPFLKIFAREKLKDKTVYLRCAMYYEQFLTSLENDHSYKILMPEVDNIIHIYKKCYEYAFWDVIVVLWNPIEKFLSDINAAQKLRALTETIDTSPKVNNLQKIFTVFVIILCIYWVALNLSGLQTSTWNYLYSFFFGLLPLTGGVVSLSHSKSWKMLNSNFGKAFFFISAGLFFWGSGNMIWVYYNFFYNLPVPYPSFADIGYFCAVLLWAVGTFFLAKATGVKFVTKYMYKKSYIIIPFIAIALSYYVLLFTVQRTYSLQFTPKIFFDLAYPSIDIVVITISIMIFTLSANLFQGKYKLSLIAILAGFACMYVGDFSFSFTTTLNQYYNGNFADLAFTIAVYLLTWGTLSFYLAPKPNTETINKNTTKNLYT